jgi:hypothetical protein
MIHDLTVRIRTHRCRDLLPNERRELGYFLLGAVLGATLAFIGIASWLPGVDL